MSEIPKEKVFSIMESFLFMSPDPRPFSDLETLFSGEIESDQLKILFEEFKNSYKQKDRGIFIEKIGKGWQFRTKAENKDYLLKIKPKSVFRLSRPSLEVLSIIAFKQPCTKMEVDEIRGMESGHLIRTLLEKDLIHLSGKSELPGKASLYKTSRKFLETFGMESLKDLPSLEEIAELFPEENSDGEKESLQNVSQTMNAEDIKIPYEKDEKENVKIKDILKSLPSTVDFLEQEKKAEKKHRAESEMQAEESREMEKSNPEQETS